MNRIQKSILYPCICLLVFMSCSVNQNLIINKDGSGYLSGNVFVEDFLLQTIGDLTDLSTPDQNNLTPLSPKSIEIELTKNPYLKNPKITMLNEGDYKNHINFIHIEDIFTPLKAPSSLGIKKPILDFQKEETIYQLSFRLNQENFEDLFILFPMLKDPGFQYFLPENNISKTEYIDMLLFLFEENSSLSPYVLKTIFQSAQLSLRIKVDGTIIATQGGEKINSSLYHIQIPLLDILLHKKEIFYSVTFK